jgi:hypothetical protein
LPALTLGPADDLTELMELVAFGFPFGTALALAKGEYPSVSVNSGSITSLRKRDGKLRIIQVDIALNPGNSGGPVLDRNGKVVGVVVAGLPGGINFIIPVNLVAHFLALPDLRFTPPAGASSSPYAPVLFQAQAVAFVPGKGPRTAELRLQAGNEPERKHVMKLDDGVYRVTTPILHKSDGPLMLRVDARYARGAVSGSVADQEFTLDGKAHRLSDVARLNSQPKGRVTFRDGRSLEGTFAGLDAVPVAFGKQKVPCNFGRAVEVTIEAPPTIESVACTVVVIQGGKEVVRQTETIAVNRR